MEGHRSKRENVKVNLTCLMRVTVDEEQIILQNQLIALSHLWTNVQQELKDKLNLFIGLIEHLEKFERQYQIISIWLKGLEKSADNKSLGSTPEKQKERIKEVRIVCRFYSFRRLEKSLH